MVTVSVYYMVFKFSVAVELGIQETEGNTIAPNAGISGTSDRNPKLRVYKEYFEKRFLEDTEAYFLREAEDFIAANPVTEYMRKVR